MLYLLFVHAFSRMHISGKIFFFYVTVVSFHWYIVNCVVLKGMTVYS